jgi:hypothetical protein
VKTNAATMVLSCLCLAVWPASAQSKAQTTNANQAEAMELLRRTIAEQQGNPNKVIRTLTNHPAPAARPLHTNIPAPGPAARPPSAPPSNQIPMPLAELERQYLEGKISAKQYQRTLVQLKQEQQMRADEENRARVLEALRQQQTTRPSISPKPPATLAVPQQAKPAKTAAPTAAAPTPAVTPEVNPQQSKISEVEARIDEMIRQKAAREKAALTNAAANTNNVPSGPQTKRQRLDGLLKQYVEGALSEADYKEKRGKILAEP